MPLKNACKINEFHTKIVYARYLYMPVICTCPLFVHARYLYMPVICICPLFVYARYLYMPVYLNGFYERLRESFLLLIYKFVLEIFLVYVFEV